MHIGTRRSLDTEQLPRTPAQPLRHYAELQNAPTLGSYPRQRHRSLGSDGAVARPSLPPERHSTEVRPSLHHAFSPLGISGRAR